MTGYLTQAAAFSLFRQPLRLSLFLALAVGWLSPAGPLQAQVVGGYRAVAVTDKEAIAAAEFAVQAQSKVAKENPPLQLGKLTKAEMQVVAGSNYRLQMDVKTGGKVRRAQAVIWAKLDRTRELTKWEWLDEN